jgi:hypothetical protein
MNLGRGGSLDNAIVLDDFRILNEDGLRYENEFVRHKILDAIGDLYLLGHSVIGEFSGYKSGHGLNNELLRELVRDQSRLGGGHFRGRARRAVQLRCCGGVKACHSGRPRQRAVTGLLLQSTAAARRHGAATSVDRSSGPSRGCYSSRPQQRAVTGLLLQSTAAAGRHRSASFKISTSLSGPVTAHCRCPIAVGGPVMPQSRCLADSSGARGRGNEPCASGGVGSVRQAATGRGSADKRAPRSAGARPAPM